LAHAVSDTTHGSSGQAKFHVPRADPFDPD
jgi:hypothetical protein